MIVLILLILLLVLPQSIVAQPAEPIIAKVGPITITEREFKTRFETFPMFRPGKTDSPENRLVLAYSLIAEKLLTLSAKQDGKDKDSAFVRAMQETRRILARDELYRRVILSHRSVSERERAAALGIAAQVRLVQYIYGADKNTIDFLASRIRNRASFHRYVFDESMDAFRDTVSVTFGDAEPLLEKVVFSLKPGEVSAAIEAAGGYMLCTVDSVMPNTEFLSFPRSQQLQKVEEILLQRKEWVLLEEYVKKTLSGKRGYSNGASVRRLSNVLFGVEWNNDTLRMSVTSENYDRLSALLKPYLNDTLYVAGSMVTTVEEGLGKLYSSRFAPVVRSESQLRMALHRQFRIWVWQSLLEDEAMRLGLDNDPSVDSQLELWSQYFLAAEMKRALSNGLSVSSWEIQRYLAESSTGVPEPIVTVEICDVPHNRSNTADVRLEHAAGFDEIVNELRKNYPRLVIRQSRVFISEGDTLAQRLWEIGVGETMSIRNRDSSLTLLRVASKNAVSDEELKRYPDAGSKVLEAKRRRSLNLFLASKRSEYPITLYDDRLKSIELTRLPMMSIRKIGFGGTLFALPPVQRLIDWLEIETPAATPLP